MSLSRLELETKQAMKYNPHPARCRDCEFVTEEENSMVDRMWDKICVFSNLCHFKTTDDASCERFIRKSK